MRLSVAFVLVVVLCLVAASSAEREMDAMKRLRLHAASRAEKQPQWLTDAKNKVVSGAKAVGGAIVGGAKKVENAVAGAAGAVAKGVKKAYKWAKGVSADLKNKAVAWGKANCGKICGKMADKVIGMVGGKLGKSILGKLVADVACDFDGSVVCEAVGLGPEDPAADACAVFVVVIACPAAVDKLTAWIGTHAAEAILPGEKACADLNICPK